VSALAGDNIEIPLLVKAEGFAFSMGEGVFIDLRKKNSEYHSIEFVIPNDAVPDSGHVEIVAYGNIMGSTISNLEHLIRLPSG
jgi:hypothetical protein